MPLLFRSWVQQLAQNGNAFGDEAHQETVSKAESRCQCHWGSSIWKTFLPGRATRVPLLPGMQIPSSVRQKSRPNSRVFCAQNYRRRIREKTQFESTVERRVPVTQGDTMWRHDMNKALFDLLYWPPKHSTDTRSFTYSSSARNSSPLQALFNCFDFLPAAIAVRSSNGPSCCCCCCCCCCWGGGTFL